MASQRASSCRVAASSSACSWPALRAHRARHSVPGQPAVPRPPRGERRRAPPPPRSWPAHAQPRPDRAGTAWAPGRFSRGGRGRERVRAAALQRGAVRGEGGPSSAGDGPTGGHTALAVGDAVAQEHGQGAIGDLADLGGQAVHEVPVVAGHDNRALKALDCLLQLLARGRGPGGWSARPAGAGCTAAARVSPVPGGSSHRRRARRSACARRRR